MVLMPCSLSRPSWGLALTPSCMSLQLELIISQSVREVHLPSAIPHPPLTPAQLASRAPPSTQPSQTSSKLGTTPAQPSQSAPTGQRCCCCSSPGYKALYPSPATDFYTSIPCITPTPVPCSGTTSCPPVPVHLPWPVVRPTAQNNQSARHPAPRDSIPPPRRASSRATSVSRETLKPTRTANCAAPPGLPTTRPPRGIADHSFAMAVLFTIGFVFWRFMEIITLVSSDSACDLGASSLPNPSAHPVSPSRVANPTFRSQLTMSHFAP